MICDGVRDSRALAQKPVICKSMIRLNKEKLTSKIILDLYAVHIMLRAVSQKESDVVNPAQSRD